MVSPHIECSGTDLPSQTGTVPAIRDANPCDVQIVAKDLSVRVHLLALAAAVVPKEAIGRLLSMAKDCSWNELGGGLPLFLQGFADAIQRPGRSHTSAVDGARLALHVIASSGVRGGPVRAALRDVLCRLTAGADTEALAKLAHSLGTEPEQEFRVVAG